MSSCHIVHIFLNFGVFGIPVFVKGNICTSLHAVCDKLFHREREGERFGKGWRYLGMQ